MDRHNSDEGALDKLIQRYLRKETDLSENKQVEAYFDSFSTRPNITDELSPRQHTAIKKRIQQQLLKRIRVQKTPQHRLRLSSKRLMVAATIILCVFSITIYLSRSIEASEDWYEISVKKGQQRQLVLEDGTKVTLNASSKLLYPKSFMKKEKREVTLTGEAFFEVAKDARKPFIIHTPRMGIRVLGTSFNVKDYSEEQRAETSLIQGKVEVWESGQETHKIMLKPKEKFVLGKAFASTAESKEGKRKGATSQPKVAVQTITVSMNNGGSLETEWMFNRITIREEPLKNIAKRLERMYGVKITIANQRAAQQLYSATFDHEKLENIIHALQAVSPFHVEKDLQGNLLLY